MQIVVTFDNYEEMVAFTGKIIRDETPVEKKETLPDIKEVEKMQIPEKESISKEEKTMPVKSPKEEKHYTLVDVRAKLAELSKTGKKAQVQELIRSFGVEKLSQIGEEQYPILMEKAGDL